eukprot:s109_g32.t1
MPYAAQCRNSDAEKTGARIFLVFPVQAREFARLEAVHVGRLMICPKGNHQRRPADVYSADVFGTSLDFRDFFLDEHQNCLIFAEGLQLHKSPMRLVPASQMERYFETFAGAQSQRPNNLKVFVIAVSSVSVLNSFELQGWNIIDFWMRLTVKHGTSRSIPQRSWRSPAIAIFFNQRRLRLCEEVLLQHTPACDTLAISSFAKGGARPAKIKMGEYHHMIWMLIHQKNESWKGLL